MQLLACFCVLLCLVFDTSTKSVTNIYDETGIGDYPDPHLWNSDDNLTAEDTKSENGTCPPEWGEYEGKCEKCDCGKDSNCTFTDHWWLGKEKTCLCKVGYEDRKGVCTATCKKNPCLNGGTCSVVNEDIKCNCKSGFYGELCENKGKDPCTPNPCQNKGKCQVSNGKVTCLCLEPFTGPNCTIDRCNPNPCQNKGKCQVSNGKLTCLCQDPFTGPNCTIDRCNPNPCQNKGKCQVSNEKVTCLCQDPFTGPNCTIDRCNPNPCKKDGECKVTKGELTCFCKDPYTGPNCTVEIPFILSSTTVETSSSTRNSTILSTHHPTSSPFDHSLNFTVGKESTSLFTTSIPTTGVDPCTENPCQNGGVCVVVDNKPKCLCKNPYLGNLCETGPCDWNPCKNGGVCKIENETFRCHCKMPFIGELCEYITNPCTENHCQNGGTCLVVGNKPKCLCKKPYLGNLCEAGPCDWNPCKNGGVCKIENETFRCYCKNDAQFAGEFCESKTKIGTDLITLDSASMFVTIVLIFVICILCLRHKAIGSS